MAYDKFIYPVWKVGIEKELEKKHVLVEGCNREYEGLIKNRGDRVKLKSLGDLTIRTMDRAKVNEDINAAEHLTDSEQEIVVDKISYFNVEVSNIDQIQGDQKIATQFYSKAAAGFAEDEDKFVANFANDALLANALVKLVNPTGLTLAKDNVLDVIDAAVTMLYENNVKESTYIELVVPPKFRRVLASAYKLLDTDNHEMMKNGRCGKYNHVVVKMSNNVAKNNKAIGSDAIGSTDMIMLRTRTACGFVEQVNKILPYTPEKKLDTDALKGYILYGGKVVRPKEMVVIPVKSYASAF